MGLSPVFCDGVVGCRPVSFPDLSPSVHADSPAALPGSRQSRQIDVAVVVGNEQGRRSWVGNERLLGTAGEKGDERQTAPGPSVSAPSTWWMSRLIYLPQLEQEPGKRLEGGWYQIVMEQSAYSSSRSCRRRCRSSRTRPSF